MKTVLVTVVNGRCARKREGRRSRFLPEPKSPYTVPMRLILVAEYGWVIDGGISVFLEKTEKSLSPFFHRRGLVSERRHRSKMLCGK
jgi:hypothetical protein